MKLCLDEQMSSRVAEGLRRKGHDVVAISETNLGNRKTADEPVLLWSIAEGRALATYNIRDFGPMLARLYALGQEHFGVILISEHTISQAHIGKQVRALDRLLRSNPGKESMKNQCVFLDAAG